MDKLKQHGFWIAVGAIGLVLIGLMVFLVFLPLGDLTAANASLDDKIKDISNLAKRKEKVTRQIQPYTKVYEDVLKKKNSALEEARQKGVDAYLALSKKFTLYFDDQEAPPAVSEFSARYNVEMDKLIKGYRDAFGIKSVAVEGQEADKDATPPKIDRVAPEQLGEDEKVPPIMKEFWYTQEVFKACNDLKLGGLKSIEFKGRFDPRKEALPYHALVEGTVQIELPPARLEDFVTALFSSERALFRLEELTYRRTPAGVTAMAPLEHTQPFKDAVEAQKVTYKDVLVEPTVFVEMRLSAFEFTKVPAEVEPKPDGKTPDKDTPKNQKKP